MRVCLCERVRACVYRYVRASVRVDTPLQHQTHGNPRLHLLVRQPSSSEGNCVHTVGMCPVVWPLIWILYMLSYNTISCRRCLCHSAIYSDWRSWTLVRTISLCCLIVCVTCVDSRHCTCKAMRPPHSQNGLET
jgi:hypothetical protein